ncbi:hypothetical protein [Mycolicibacterium pyrenivorans]|uniref:hypothetical protein n=1 Tax=Mycolicibacterium pyrenivorans TaxID=187102 RepID=UPI0021F2D2B7|nr:hypothetical protein [Mycolicibacterium pyrenivorans]MCV7153811.1 hypothetical protein [Mycolicibacterium pyrenivorans]
MKVQVLPYVTVEVDDRVRRRLRIAGERLRVNLRAYLRSAADDVDTVVDTAGDRVRGMCDRAVNRVDSVVAGVNDKIGADCETAPTDAPSRPHLRVVGREAS